MSVRNDYTSTYSEAMRHLTELWRTGDETVRCPGCRHTAHEWFVVGDELHVRCEYCEFEDWMVFTGGVPWSENH